MSVAMEGTGAFRDKILPYPKRRHEMDANQRVDLLNGQQREAVQMEVEDELNDAEDCGVDHEEDTIELKKFITRVSGQRCMGVVHSGAVVHSFSAWAYLQPHLSVVLGCQQRDKDGVRQYLVQLSDDVGGTQKHRRSASVSHPRGTNRSGLRSFLPL